ncbi:NXPE family member 3 isoform X1 [Alosa sapidissima]|uniref:NXPE family member 3 isoform X1 n=1 Tax=Alosa sapidissima TaxID=34773 RepID=UPI001C0A3DDD|nr:NXPE family member 3 isoform X1 [Alosa sapidissima]XP_041925596.1 NXPE family member 3 isoform X1 [Alosa sapidissima]
MATAMGGNLSKYAPIFLVLALSGILFLLRNMHTLERWNCQSMSSLYQLQSSISSAFKPSGAFLLLDHNHTYCPFLGQEPSSEEAREERYLLESISWPEPPTPGTPPLRFSSDPARSFFVIQPPASGRGASGQSVWRVGGKLEVLVHMQNFLGQPKRHGGDFLLARIYSPELGAGASGRVTDHQDGLYTVELPLLWLGPAQVEVMLVHSSEVVAVLRRLREEQPDRVYFKSLFRSGFLSETTVCNLCLRTRPRQPALCNYTDPHSGEPWYCYKPRLLDCDTRINHAKGGYKKHLLTTTESMLFLSSTIKAPIQALGMDNITISPAVRELSLIRRDRSKLMPSGYYYQGSWRPLSGIPIQQFNDSSAITQCLRGKLFYMFGDSTVRQWFEYLNAFVPELKEFNLYSPKNVGPFMAVDSVHNILLQYRCHGPPIRFSTVSASELRYVANELDGLPGGPDTVVALSVWSHFSTFPVEVYMRRLRHIRRAVARLLDRAPGTLVVIRSANPQKLDAEVCLYNSDWFSVQLDAVLRAMFRGLRGVVLLDAWDMTLAHPTQPHLLHPPPDIVKNMIDLILSHVCPAKKERMRT